jgi:hypothetical protein
LKTKYKSTQSNTKHRIHKLENKKIQKHRIHKIKNKTKTQNTQNRKHNKKQNNTKNRMHKTENKIQKKQHKNTGYTQ